jgi:hypothetical protein
MFHLHPKTKWNDYFPETSPTNSFYSQAFNSRQSPSYLSLYVSNCLFISISSTSDGGALYTYNSITLLLVESTSFFSCKTTGSYGGALYFYRSSGQSVLHEVCGFDCSANANYHFAWIHVNDVASSKNYINYSSISRCVNENSGKRHMFGLYCGKICFPSVNVSLIKCYGQSYYYYPFADSNSVTCSLSYSSFVDNIAIEYTCFYLCRGGANYEIKSCNILRNTQGTLGTQGTIATWGNLEIKDSCILENKATYIFYQGSSYTITLSNCTVDSASNNGYMTTKNTVTKGFILGLNHMSTQNCHSEYDSAGYLTPIIQTMKKQRLCYTGDRFFYQCPQRDLFLLIFISFVLKLLP